MTPDKPDNPQSPDSGEGQDSPANSGQAYRSGEDTRAQGELSPEMEALAESVTRRPRKRLDEMAARYHYLEAMLAVIVSALILLSLGVNLYMFKQMRLARAQMHTQRGAMTRMMQEFHENREPAIRSFVTKVEAFAQDHPDYKPILEKYRPFLGKYMRSEKISGTGTTPAPAGEPLTEE